MQAVPIIKKAAGKLIEYVRTRGNPGNDKEKELREVQEKIREKNERLRKLRRQLAAKDKVCEELRREVGSLRARQVRVSPEVGIETGCVRPENVVWVFGTGRSGSTWLASMIDDLKGHTVWREPKVGALFGDFYYTQISDQQRNDKNFILGQHREAWLGSIRSFVLDGANARFPEIEEEGYLTVKEPNGSIGAPLLAEALPESRIILLVRDPRDVIASILDAFMEGGWNYGRKEEAGWNETLALGEQPTAFVEVRAYRYLREFNNAKMSYEAHGGPKTLMRYEDLKDDTLGTMKRSYSELGITLNEEELTRVVKQHSWENIPAEKKGEGKFYRKARPGSWREDLTTEQTNIVESITAPVLEAFYSG